MKYRMTANSRLATGPLPTTLAMRRALACGVQRTRQLMFRYFALALVQHLDVTTRGGGGDHSVSP